MGVQRIAVMPRAALQLLSLSKHRRGIGQLYKSPSEELSLARHLDRPGYLCMREHTNGREETHSIAIRLMLMVLVLRSWAMQLQ